MTTPEDRLRQLLQAEQDDVVPAGDGMSRIAQRIAQRRSWRSRLGPAIAIAGVVAIAAVAAVTVSLTDDSALDQAVQPNASERPQPSGCSGGLCPEPRPSATLSATGVTTSGNGTPVWPFTTDAQAADWQAKPGSRTWAGDPVAVTQHFLDDYLKLPGKAVRRLDGSSDVAVIEVSAGDRPVSQVRLERLGRDTRGPWSVTGATSDDLTISDPKPAVEVSSPLEVVGSVSGYDQSVHVQLLATGELAGGYAPAGAELPWRQPLRWTRSDWSVAALVGSTYDGKGDLFAVAVTPVRRSGGQVPGLPVAGSTLVALSGRYVVTVDALTGRQLRQLSYPPDDATDSGPDRGGEDGVVWVRTRGDGCTSSILRAGLVYGPAGITVDAKPIMRSLPSLSAGGRSLGWVEQPCGGGPATVVVRGPDAQFSTIATSPETINDIDVRDDGYAVVALADRAVVLAPGAIDVSAARPLTVGTGCTVTAPAWDGVAVIAWERCGQQWTLGRWSTAGARTGAGIAVAGISFVMHTASDSGQVLVWLADQRVARLSEGSLVDIPNGLQWLQPDW